MLPQIAFENKAEIFFFSINSHDKDDDPISIPMIGVKPGVSEWVRPWPMPNILQRKSAFHSPHLWGVAEEKHAKQSQLECKLPVVVFQGRGKNKRRILQCNDLVVMTGKRQMRVN